MLMAGKITGRLLAKFYGIAQAVKYLPNCPTGQKTNHRTYKSSGDKIQSQRRALTSSTFSIISRRYDISHNLLSELVILVCLHQLCAVFYFYHVLLV